MAAYKIEIEVVIFLYLRTTLCIHRASDYRREISIYLQMEIAIMSFMDR